MKDIFDNPNFGDFKLNSRIVRTGLWESQNESQKNLSADIFLRYETLAKNMTDSVTILIQSILRYSLRILKRLLLLFISSMFLYWLK